MKTAIIHVSKNILATELCLRGLSSFPKQSNKHMGICSCTCFISRVNFNHINCEQNIKDLLLNKSANELLCKWATKPVVTSIIWHPITLCSLRSQ